MNKDVKIKNLEAKLAESTEDCMELEAELKKADEIIAIANETYRLTMKDLTLAEQVKELEADNKRLREALHQRDVDDVYATEEYLNMEGDEV